MEAKFGSAERTDEIFATVTQEAAKEGVIFDLEAIEVASNTLNAHRLIRWAGEAGVQDAVKEACLSAFFCEGRDVGDIDVLAAIADANGMDGALVRTRLEADEDVAQVQAEIAEARRIGVTGVPCFIFDQRTGMVGAQPSEAIVAALDEIIAKAA